MNAGSLKNLALVVFVTLLVWLLAESESLRVDKPQVRVIFRTEPDSGRLVRLDPNQDFNGTVTLRLEGSTAGVDALSDALKKEIRLDPGDEGVPAEPGRHTVSLATALRATPLFRDSGVVITDVDPPTAVILVDNVVNVDAKVRVDIPDGQLLEAAPEPTPASVPVRMPSSLARDLGVDFTVTARLDPAVLGTLPEGRRSTVTVPVELPERVRSVEGVRALQPTVAVTLTLRSRNASTTLASVPVHLRLAPTELGRWDIEVPETSRQLTDVTVHGPSDLIAQIEQKALNPIAFVPLTFEELEKAAADGRPIEKEAVFSELHSPLRFEVRQRMVRIIVNRRDEGRVSGAGE